MRLFRFSRSALACKKGVASIEFAFIAPIVIWLTMAVFELGIIILKNVVLEGAATAAGRVAITYYSGGATIADITHAFFSNLGGINNSLFPPGSINLRYVDCVGGTGVSGGPMGAPGDAGGVTCFEFSHNYHFVTPFLGDMFTNPYPIKAVAAIRLEAEL